MLFWKQTWNVGLENCKRAEKKLIYWRRSSWKCVCVWGGGVHIMVWATWQGYLPLTPSPHTFCFQLHIRRVVEPWWEDVWAPLSSNKRSPEKATPTKLYLHLLVQTVNSIRQQILNHTLDKEGGHQWSFVGGGCCVVRLLGQRSEVNRCDSRLLQQLGPSWHVTHCCHWHPLSLGEGTFLGKGHPPPKVEGDGTIWCQVGTFWKL